MHYTSRGRHAKPAIVIDAAGRKCKGYRYRYAQLRTRGARLRQGARLHLSGGPACDPLTGLPDRRAFDARLTRILSRPAAARQSALAVLFIDVDDFKAINDRFGHAAGDAVLIELAGRLTRRLRPGDLISRRGGDEFTILLDGLRDCGDALRVAERIQSSLRTPLAVEGRRLPVAVSIGIALRRASSDRAQDILRRADEAMYRAKASGKARTVVDGN